MAKLGGERRDPDPRRDRSRWHARVLFLDALREVAPEVLETLRSSVYPLYQRARHATSPELPEQSVTGLWRLPHYSTEALRALAELRPDEHAAYQRAGGTAASSSEPPRRYGPRVEDTAPESPSERPVLPPWCAWSFERGNWNDASVGDSPELEALRDGLCTWARRFRLDVGWLLDVALRTLSRWDHGLTFDRFAEPHFFAIAAGPHFSFSVPGRRVFEYMPWHPQWTTREQYEREATAAFKTASAEESGETLRRFSAALRDYLDEQAAQAEAAGLDPAPRKYAEVDADDHARSETRSFRWLARCLTGTSAATIASEAGVSTRAVERSNRRLADLLGL